MTAARTAAEEYARTVNAGDLEGLVELFGDDAQVIQRSGTFTGKSEIREFYRDTILPHGPQLVATRFVTSDDTCIMEAVSTTNAGRRSEIADLFDVDDAGRVTRLSIYFR